MFEQIKTVLFDLGGTLFEHLESTTSEANLRSVATQLSSPVKTPDFSDDRFVTDYRTQRSLVEQQWVPREFFLHKDLVMESFYRTARCQLKKCVLSDEELATYASEFCNQQRRSVTTELQPRRGVFETLQTLNQRGYLLGIVSNIDEDYLQPLVRKHSLHHHFAFCLSSEAARCCKPSSGIFRQAQNIAADHLKQPLTAKECLYIGDSPQHDIEGAHRAGMPACLFGAGENYGDALRHITDPPQASINSFDHLLNLVKTRL